MSRMFESRAEADRASELLRIFCQSQRLMILSLLLRGERTVGEIDSVTGIGQPALSQQLAELRRARMVRTRRAAKQVHYDLADDEVRKRVRAIEAVVSGGDIPSSDQAANAEMSRQPFQTNLSGAAAFAQIL